MDPPRSEAAFAAALPLDGLDAWRIYLGLPMFGARIPPGGPEEFMRLAGEDVVLNVYGPVFEQAIAEFEPVLAELRLRFGLGSGPLGLLGGSAGAAIAQLVLAESSVSVAAAVLVSPVVQLRPVVEAGARHFGVTYNWSDRSLEVARRIDFVARAHEIAEQHPAILLVAGEEDDPGIRGPAAALRDALAGSFADPGRVSLATIPGMGHALAEEPGVEPAPQIAHAAAVDRLAVDWFGRQLT
jgi:alpha-beta hydrolase superfamily lysophospholipase